MIPVGSVSPVGATPRPWFRAGGAVVMAAILGACEGSAPTPTAPPAAPPAAPAPPPAAMFAPCPGVSVAAQQPVRSVAFDDHLSTNITVELSTVAAGTGLDFLGPYNVSEYHNPYMAGRISGWRVETAGELVRHELTVDWTQELEQSDLRLGLVGGQCLGRPVVVCSAAGCSLTEN